MAEASIRASEFAGRLGNSSSFTNNKVYSSYKEQLSVLKERRKISELELKNVKAAENYRKKLRESDRKEDEKERLLAIATERQKRKISAESVKTEISDWATAWKERNKESLEMAVAAGDSFSKKLKAGISYATSSLVGGLAKAASNATINLVKNGMSAAMKSVDSSLNVYTQYMSAVDARLQGAYNGLNYQSIIDLISDNVSGNPYIKFQDVLSNTAAFVEKGVAQNLTQRAFLATISSKIATTFNAMDETLLRLARIQRDDTTAERLGMEASLTQLFNYYFSDTSYLSQAFDNVASAVVDLSSQLSSIGSVEVEYMIQKWLGTLGSSGVSNNTLTTMAEAINALGSGDVDYFSGSESMRNLMVLSLNRTGLEFGDILQNGLNSLQMNDLLYNMILMVRESVSGTNNVVKSKYADLFGLTMADVASIEALNASTINELYNQAMSGVDMTTELNAQLLAVPDRMHFSEKVQNSIDNLLYATGMNVANNPVSYMMYKIADIVEGFTGGIEIPVVGAIGNFLDLGNSVEELIKIGVVGSGLLGSLGSAISNWASGNLLDYNKWTTQYEKGDYTGFTSKNVLSTTTSSTGFVTNTDTKGIQQSLVDEQSKSAEEINGEQPENEVVELLKSILDYLTTNGTQSNPYNVAVVEAKKVDSANGSDGNLEKRDLVSLITELLSIVNTRGTIIEPLYITSLLSGNIWG